LIRVFSTLKKQERRQLAKWVRSPFFNQRQDVVLLFQHIDKYIGVSDRQLTKAKAFSKVFPNQPYDDLLMRHTMSFLMKQIKQYLIWSEMEQSEFGQQLHLAKNLRRKGLTDLMHRTLDQAEAKIEASTKHNADRHLQLFQLQTERQAATIRQQRRGEMGLQKQTDEFANYFAANLLRQACGIATHQSMTRQEYDILLLKEVLEKIEEGKFADIPAVQIYYHAYRAQESLDNEQHFKAATDLLEQYWQAFPISEARDLFLLTINFGIKKINKGQATYRREVFDLYRSGLEKTVLLDGGTISPFTYNRR
jgi:hypothetical protein